MPAVKPSRVAALLNSSAGSLEGDGGAKLSETLAAAFEKHGIAAKLHFLPGAELQAGARQALEQFTAGNLDAIVVGGGDGSIRTVAAVLAGTGVPLGILPLGTLNHFARDLGTPASIDEAVAAIATGEVRSVDVGEVNGEVFINNSSIGIYPALVVDRERRRSLHGLGKWTAMALAALRTLRRFPLRRLSICAEDCVEPYRSPCVFVGNNEYGLSGPTLGKREKLDSGELCLYIAKRQSRLALFWLACRSVAGWLDESRDLRILKISRAMITSRTSRLLVALDGEVMMIRPPLHYRTRARSLRVFARPAIS
jgi:diacylglycerol kinase family enzyme